MVDAIVPWYVDFLYLQVYFVDGFERGFVAV